MDEGELKVLMGAVSRARFRPFLKECNGDPVRALRLYAWDSEISGAFLGPMRQFEITLRNGLHDRLATLYGQADWWHVPKIVLNRTGSQQIVQAEEAILKRHSRLSTDNMIARLPLVFWVGLLSKGANYETQFWRPALRHAFPGYSGGRAELHRQLNYLRHFQNRIGHRERIFHRHLEADFRAVCRVIRYMAPEVATYVERHCLVPAALARKAKVLSGEEPPRL